MKTKEVYKPYSEKLKDPRWQKKRLEILQRDDFTCVHCGDKEAELHVHHRGYLKGKQPWDYPNSMFDTLCRECHENVTDHLRVISDIMHNMSPVTIEALATFLETTWCTIANENTWALWLLSTYREAHQKHKTEEMFVSEVMIFTRRLSQWDDYEHHHSNRKHD